MRERESESNRGLLGPEFTAGTAITSIGPTRAYSHPPPPFEVGKTSIVTLPFRAVNFIHVSKYDAIVLRRR